AHSLLLHTVSHGAWKKGSRFKDGRKSFYSCWGCRDAVRLGSWMAWVDSVVGGALVPSSASGFSGVVINGDLHHGRCSNEGQEHTEDETATLHVVYDTGLTRDRLQPSPPAWPD